MGQVGKQMLLASATATTSAASGIPVKAVVMAGLAGGALFWLKNKLDEPSRAYKATEDYNSVAAEYDAWTEEGVLEEYWGEHIHLGYYSDEDRAKGAFKKSSIKARYEFIDRMMKFAGVAGYQGSENDPDAVKPAKILDVGCGFGGTSRYLAKALPESEVTGITISPAQVKRGTEMNKEQGVANAQFKIVDAMNMTFADNTFDLVWACESGEHMPDKKKYVEEMVRVLKPGGRLVIATWCQRDNSTSGFTPEEEKKLDFLYSEWTHPFFISYEDYGRLVEGTGTMEQVVTDDWAKETLPSWRHAIYDGLFRPWFIAQRPHLWWKTLKDIWCMNKMHLAFEEGLMTYGMIKGIKKPIAASE